jgi:colanic acid biosynthesis glycosyl transferase WcaI
VHWFAARGHALSVVAASEGERRGPGNGAGGAVRVLRCVAPNERTGGFTRAVRHVAFAVASAPTLLSEAAWFRPDLVGALTPSASVASAALAAASVARVPAWLHLEEDAPPLGVEPRFACVSAASLDADERLERRGVAPRARHALAPWVDTFAVAPPDEPSPIRAAFTTAADDVIALYVGSCAGERVAQILLEAARRVPPKGAIRFVIAAEGPGAAMLAAAAKTLPRLTVLHLPPQGDLAALLAAADIHLAPEGLCAPDPLVPAKLATLLASGRPIVAPPGAAFLPAVAAAMVEAAPSGEGLAAAVVRLAAAPAEMARRGRAARLAAEDYFAKERLLRPLERRLIALAAA